jgi:hypothetical protein
MFDPVGTVFAPREYSQFSVRTDLSKHRMNTVGFRPWLMVISWCQPAQPKGEKSWTPFHAARCWQRPLPEAS